MLRDTSKIYLLQYKLVYNIYRYLRTYVSTLYVYMAVSSDQLSKK